jgi:hypothetical protein
MFVFKAVQKILVMEDNDHFEKFTIHYSTKIAFNESNCVIKHNSLQAFYLLQ